MQLSIKTLKELIKDLPDDLPIFFRKISPVCGNIEEAYSIKVTHFSSFGIIYPCVIIEPAEDESNLGE